jgi:hypothetical protein
MLAFIASLARGMLHGGDPESVLWLALCHLLAFMLVGGAIGGIGVWVVEDVVRNRLTAASASRRKPAESPLGHSIEGGQPT